MWQSVDCKREGRHICLLLGEGPTQRATSLDAFGEIGVSQVLTHTYTHHASVCVSIELGWGGGATQ